MAEDCPGGLRSMRSSSFEAFCAPVTGLVIPAQICEEEVLVSSELRIFLGHPKGGDCQKI